MLKNYFKIAIVVLKRRKFFTFVSLFGISFTLSILMVGTAFLDKVVSPDYPDYKRDRSLYVGSMELQNSKEGWMNRSDVSFYFFEHYVSRLKNVEKMGISSYPKASNAYVNNKKIVINYKYTNADYWRVLEYRFLEGKPYSEQQILNRERVAVISLATKKAYFGDVPSVVGQYISADEVNYRVIGVVANVAKTMRNFAGDMFLPYTVSKENYNKPDLMGPYSAVLLARSKADVPKMKLEFDQMMRKVPIGNKEFDRLYCNADYFFASITRRIAGDGKDSGITRAVSVLVAFVILFLLLPTINLVNINITRIMERSSEIGVRKAFGASSRTLVCQFIVENMILTFLGGLLGLLFSALIIYFFNSWNLIDSVRLSLNFSVLMYSFLACVFFGLISGVYPAWRMSRLNVVKALKAQ
ncbi:ABC transporter permease [Pedobacter sp. HMWF019]|uniref:ABC transporter permease n=1 Tax=Pedobacter sp. HMWF019 TaxID=2056856 RepID=UPI000D341EB9|nr:ABC transporter permease [Pedobacter sp. HMWF019]PTS99040.1 ABC transporter permease [Pedobacter sp. HMWF019]